METQTLTIPKISCAHCVMAIKNELTEIEGVNNVDGDPEGKTITVKFSDPVTLEKIKETLTEINYPAQ